MSFFNRGFTFRFIFSASLIVFCVGALSLFAEDDLLKREYERNLKNLTGDSPDAKLHAAFFFRAKRNARYIRPIGRELLRELDKNSTFRRSAAFDPFIKMQLARALGDMGGEESLNFLIEAIAKVDDVIALERKEAREKTKRENDFLASSGKDEKGQNEKVSRILIEPTKPGPALYQKESALPYSPDAYWSPSNEHKENISISNENVQQRFRLMGYNYINLSLEMFDAIGDIYFQMGGRTGRLGPDAGFFLSNYFSSDIPVIRGAVALALAKTGTAKAQGFLDGQLVKEKDDSVRIKICRGIFYRNRAHSECYKNTIKYLYSDEDELRYEAAVTLRDFRFGESLEDLKKAYNLEERDFIKGVIRQAIEGSFMDSKMPVSVN